MAVKEPAKGHVSLMETLVAKQLVSEEVLQKGHDEAVKHNRALFRVLVEQGALGEKEKLEFLHHELGLPVVSLRDIMPRPEVSGFLSPEQCRRHHLVPLRIEGGKLLTAMEDPTDVRGLKALEAGANMDVKPVLASMADIELAISRMPDLESEAATGGAGGWARKGVLLLLTFLPAVAFYVYIFLTKHEGGFVAELDGFGRVLFLVLTWGSWASVAFFLTDLVFGPKKR